MDVFCVCRQYTKISKLHRETALPIFESILRVLDSTSPFFHLRKDVIVYHNASCFTHHAVLRKVSDTGYHAVRILQNYEHE